MSNKIERRSFLKCMAWAGTGVVWAMNGGVLSSTELVLGAKGKARFNFVQISDSHIGFNKDPNHDVTKTLQEAVDKINALEDAAPVHAPPAWWSSRTAVEQAIAGIWRELLGHDRFGADEVFLAAGGDSLLAMRVLTRIRQLLGVDVALPDFLRVPTVAALAEAVERERAKHQRANDAELARLLDEIERGQ